MREVTLLFADVRGFSRISEGMDAEALIRFMNKLFTPLSEVILEKRGTIDKFMGDAVMAFWNAPLADPQHAANACRAALAMQAELGRMNTVPGQPKRLRKASKRRRRFALASASTRGPAASAMSDPRSASTIRFWETR